MGGKCCSGSDRKPDKNGSDATAAPQLPLIEFLPKGGDADKFDEAHQANDISALISLMSSKQNINTFSKPVHPWAQSPKTVGVLAVLHLAYLASKREDYPNAKTSIGDADVIPTLVKCLSSKDQDSKDAGVICLYHLTSSCPANSQKAYENGAVRLLIPLTDSIFPGLRCAAATVLRNICKVSIEVQQDMIKTDGVVKGIVDQLQGLKGASDLNVLEVQLETILNVQDIVEDPNGKVVEEYAIMAIKAGAIPKLKQLCDAKDEDICEAAKETYETLYERRQAVSH